MGAAWGSTGVFPGIAQPLVLLQQKALPGHCGAPAAAPWLVPAGDGDSTAGPAARARLHSPGSRRGDAWMGAALSTPGSRFTAAQGGCESNQEAVGEFRHLQGQAAVEWEYGAPRSQFSTKTPKFCQNLS